MRQAVFQAHCDSLLCRWCILSSFWIFTDQGLWQRWRGERWKFARWHVHQGSKKHQGSCLSCYWRAMAPHRQVKLLFLPHSRRVVLLTIKSSAEMKLCLSLFPFVSCTHHKQYSGHCSVSGVWYFQSWLLHHICIWLHLEARAQCVALRSQQGFGSSVPAELSSEDDSISIQQMPVYSSHRINPKRMRDN